MAPSKAPDASGPARAQGTSSKNPDLTPRELHQIVLRVVRLAALAESPTVTAGSRIERRLHEALLKIDRLVEEVEERLPLADMVDSKGSAIGGFRISDFELVALADALTSVCRGQKKLMGTRHFKTEVFCREIFNAFASAGLPVELAVAARMARHVREHEHHKRPSIIAGVILQAVGLPGMREIQNLKRVREKAQSTRGTLRRNDHYADMMTVQEFLSCIQVRRSEVPNLAGRILALREKRRRGRGDYSLSDVAPVIPPHLPMVIPPP